VNYDQKKLSLTLSGHLESVIVLSKAYFALPGKIDSRFWLCSTYLEIYH